MMYHDKILLTGNLELNSRNILLNYDKKKLITFLYDNFFFNQYNKIILHFMLQKTEMEKVKCFCGDVILHSIRIALLYLSHI